MEDGRWKDAKAFPFENPRVSHRCPDLVISRLQLGETSKVFPLIFLPGNSMTRKAWREGALVSPSSFDLGAIQA